MISEYQWCQFVDKPLKIKKWGSGAVAPLHILFFEPDVTFVQDVDRSPVIEADREKYSNQIKDLIQNHGKEFVCISGDYQSRYEQAVASVEKLLK